MRIIRVMWLVNGILSCRVVTYSGLEVSPNPGVVEDCRFI
jgi:hypothetical protein